MTALENKWGGSIHGWRIRPFGLFRVHASSGIAFRLFAARHTRLKADIVSSVFYIGLGDRIDDERRLVRESASARSAQGTPTDDRFA